MSEFAILHAVLELCKLELGAAETAKLCEEGTSTTEAAAKVRRVLADGSLVCSTAEGEVKVPSRFLRAELGESLLLTLPPATRPPARFALAAARDEDGWSAVTRQRRLHPSRSAAVWKR